jgi:energy-coupling factor transport system permease protein
VQYQRLLRTALPLLASAIRGAERKALAMDARAFGAFATRTYYRRLRFSFHDGLFVLAYWLVCIGTLALLNWPFVL